MRSRKVISQGRHHKRDHVCAHVPAVRQECHRVRDHAGCDFQQHHRNGDRYHYPRASLRAGEIVREVVRMPKTSLIDPMHSLLYNIAPASKAK